MQGSLVGKVAIVTGASRGIGLAIAERFAAEGASVAIVARTVEPRADLPGSLGESVERIESRGGRCLAIAADLTDAGSRAKIVESARAKFGGVDILVNNAARAFYEPAQTISEKRLRLSFELNFLAPIDLTQRAVPLMRERGGGAVVNLSSATSRSPAGPPYDEFARTRGVGTYAASKAALERMTTALAAELYADGISVNSLAPVGAVRTEAAEQLGVIPPEADAEPVEDMAEAALALCNGDPRRLTGRITYSGQLLEELGIRTRALDGGPFGRA
ncbi:MAG: SDR family NAD(P)-dependent oxidoreductase [Myxococcota bacterium]